ncbi:MAG: sulfatase [Planctomycetes bacterium]|nr:sulfatase [Planctomycetota bacterium]
MTSGRAALGWLVLAAAGALAFGIWWFTAGRVVRRPDVVFVLIDTLRADRLACYGYPRPTSPFLDSLAARGVLFEDATCQFSWTRPSMVSLMEGRYLTGYRDAIEPDAPTLAESFRRAGYRTVGLVANASVNAETGFARGFEHYDSGDMLGRGPVYADDLRDVEELASALWEPLDRALAPATDGERAPVFLYLHVMDVHDPYDAYAEHATELPETGAVPVTPAGWQLELLRAHGPPTSAPDATHADDLAELERERGRYDQGVRHTDAQLEWLFGELGERGLLDHAVVAIAADHGEGLWEHLTPATDAELATFPAREFFYQKHGASQFQEVIATPLVFVAPGARAGLRVREAVENVDLFPTLLEFCDLAAPEGLHGRSLAAVARGEAPASSVAREFVYSFGVHGNSLREVATGLKLVMPRGKALAAGHAVQLYELGSDPDERRDLASERPDDVRRLLAAFVAWEARYPTDPTLRAKTAERLKAEREDLLKGLGYTGLDVGGEE